MTLERKTPTGANREGAVEVSLYMTNSSSPQDKTQSKINILGKAARSLRLLKGSPAGLTRMEALERYGILSLTQHVHTLRHDHGIHIETEWIFADENTKYGRYHLISKIDLYTQENDGAA